MNDHKRRLAAVMFTDIYGYSAKMSRDENAALSLLKEHNRLLTGIIENHSGHVLKTMGDAFFVEFDAAFSAVACAVEIQKRLKEYNQDRPQYDRVVIRIGLHLGDVIVDGDDLYGEGVNVAARLQPLAEPGGICMSQAVYQAVKSHTALEAVHHGEVELKNIVEKYVVYKIPSTDPPLADDAARGVERRVAADSAREVERRAAPGVLNFKVKSVQKWPTVEVNQGFYILRWAFFSWIAIITIFRIFLMIRELPVMQTQIRSVFKVEDVVNPVWFASHLKSNLDPISRYVREQLSDDGRLFLENYSTGEPLPEGMLAVLCEDINKVMTYTVFPFSDSIGKSAGLGKEQTSELVGVQTRVNHTTSQGLKHSFNHELFWAVYSDDLSWSRDLGPYKYLSSPFEIVPLLSSSLILIFVWLVFFSLPTTIKITFIDARNLDQAIDFITGEMKFTLVNAKSKRIQYQRWGIFGAMFRNFGRLKLTLDGNTLLLTSSATVIRKIKRLLKMHFEPL